MLSPGIMIGPYEIQSALGAGGMGEVYRARDTRLDRTVAIKILSQELAADPQFHERFDREAKAISQLNHPNICTLYDVGEASVSHETASPTSIRFLVMEFLEGETLATRLERGALKLEEALKIAAEISGALDEAHRAGIVHRDLKPGNVMLTRSGAKLLDFGLAKQTASPLTSRRGSAIAAAGAASGALTAEGAIIGTFQYMAPEQLEGVDADARADIFAFGAILYEMVTGRKAFEGKTPISLITSILRDEPAPVATLLPVAPKALDRVIRACMAKDPDSRLRSPHDLSLQLKWLAEGDAQGEPGPAAAPAIRRKRSMDLTRVLGGALIVATAAAIVLAVRIARQAPAAAEQIQFTMPAPEDSVFFNQPTFAVSPDGRQIVFIATTPAAPMLFVRSLGSLTIRPLPGTEQATYPFWSPDSRSVAFFAAGKLKKIQVGGGAPNVLCDAATGRGGTWSRDNIVLFASSATGPLLRVDAAGGSPTLATTLDDSRGETAHRWPSFLPDGRHFLYVAVSGGQRPSDTRVGSLDSREATTLFAGDSLTAYASGHLFFWRDGGVMAQPFDAGARRLSGDPVPVATPVGQAPGVGYVSFSASQTGVIVYSRGIARPISQPTWKNRAGRLLGTAAEPGDYINIALSPDERRAAVGLMTGTPENRDLWLIEFARSGRVRLTSDPASEVLPNWSPDGTQIIFGSVKSSASGLYVMNADGSGSEKLLVKFDESAANPLDWSRDGRFVLYYSQSPKTGTDLWVLPLTGDKKPFPFLQTAFNEDNGTFAPDTKWIAYVSNESSRDEVYVQPFPATGAKYRVSSNGGTYPMWRGDGRELFFIALDGTMMAAAIKSGPGIEPGIPQALFPSGIALTGNRRQYAVTKDGQRFLLNVPLGRSTPTPLTVVVNWQGGR